MRWTIACFAALAVAAARSTRVLLELEPAGAFSSGETVQWAGATWRVVERLGDGDTAAARLSSSSGEEEEEIKPPNPEFFIYLGISIGLVVMAGIMAGCTMGLLSLDLLTLRLKVSSAAP